MRGQVLGRAASSAASGSSPVVAGVTGRPEPFAAAADDAPDGSGLAGPASGSKGFPGAEIARQRHAVDWDKVAAKAGHSLSPSPARNVNIARLGFRRSRRRRRAHRLPLCCRQRRGTFVEHKSCRNGRIN